MTVRFVNPDPKWSCFYAEVNKDTQVSIWSDGDVVFDVDAPDGGTVDFTLTINDMQEIVEKYIEYTTKREALLGE